MAKTSVNLYKSFMNAKIIYLIATDDAITSSKIYLTIQFEVRIQVLPKKEPQVVVTSQRKPGLSE